MCVWFGACMCALGPFVYALPGLDGEAGLLPTACRRFNWCCCRRRSDYILKTHRTICQRARPKPHRDIQRRASGPLAAHCCCCSCPVGADAAWPWLLRRLVHLELFWEVEQDGAASKMANASSASPKDDGKKMGAKVGKEREYFFLYRKPSFSNLAPGLLLHLTCQV